MVDESGNFNFGLYSSDWTIDVSKQEMNVTPLALTVKNESESIELIANPANISLTFRVFLDTNNDGNFSNGTTITPTFNITSIDQYGMSLLVTEDMYDSETGELNVNLSVGVYSVVMLADDPRAENASAYMKRSVIC